MRVRKEGVPGKREMLFNAESQRTQRKRRERILRVGGGFIRVLNLFGGTTNGQDVPRGKPWDRQPVSGKLRRKLAVCPGFATFACYYTSSNGIRPARASRTPHS